MGPRLGDLSTKLTSAAAVLVDHVVQRHIVPCQLLLLRDDQSPVDVWTTDMLIMWGIGARVKLEDLG